MIVAYLEKDITAIKNKNLDDLKKIIQTYIEKVVIFEEHVEVFLVLFVHMIGGGEPIPRTYPSLCYYTPLSVIRFTPANLECKCYL